MGCGICSFGEKRESGRWVAISEDNHPLGYQDCEIFAFLAGVRNHHGIEPISKPRGLPSDAGRLAAVQFDMWGGDAHQSIRDAPAFTHGEVRIRFSSLHARQDRLYLTQ